MPARVRPLWGPKDRVRRRQGARLYFPENSDFIAGFDPQGAWVSGDFKDPAGMAGTQKTNKGG